MEINLRRIESFYMVTRAGVLLFRTAETAEHVLAVAREATTDGRVSADHAEIMAAIKTLKNKADKNAYFKQQMANLKNGHIVGVIIETDDVAQIQREN